MIEAWVYARNFGKLGSAMAVGLSRGSIRWKRSFNCGKLTTNQCELKAVEYCLKSIKSDYYGEKVVVKSWGRYVEAMLKKKDGKWEKEAQLNVDLVNVVRTEFDKFSDLSVIHGMDDSSLAPLKEMCEVVTSDGKVIFDR